MATLRVPECYPRFNQREAEGMKLLRRLRAASAIAASLAVAGVSACGDDRDSSDAAADDEFIAFHWPASEPDPHVRMCKVFGTGEHIALHPEPIIGVQHFDSAYVADPQEPFVTVRLTADGRAVLDSATADQLGRGVKGFAEAQSASRGPSCVHPWRMGAVHQG
jgi:hypothetical protein